MQGACGHVSISMPTSSMMSDHDLFFLVTDQFE